jgi:hypothetical protein
MKFEEMFALARKGGKFRRPAMGTSYVTIAKVAENGRLPVYLPRLLLVVGGMNHMTFTMSNIDIMAEDWENAEPIVKVKMFASAFKVACPSCGKTYPVGEKWEYRVGDVQQCDCGNKLLLEPPKLIEDKPAATPMHGCRLMSDKIKENQAVAIDPWPKA